MSLENLLAIGRLKQHPPARNQIANILQMADRALKDARIAQASAETRFDAAYKTIMQCSLAALMAKGYRPATNQPGHHATLIQVLPTTIGLAPDRMVVLDRLRARRNRVDYEAEPIEDAVLQSCVAEATRLLADVRAWLKSNYPNLV